MLRVLVAARERHGDKGPWFKCRLAELARRAHLKYSTAKWAISRLRAAGLLACDRHTVERDVYDQRPDARGHFSIKRVTALVENWYAVRGRITRAGVELPADTWRVFVDRARSTAGIAAARGLPAARPEVAWWESFAKIDWRRDDRDPREKAWLCRRIVSSLYLSLQNKNELTKVSRNFQNSLVEARSMEGDPREAIARMIEHGFGLNGPRLRTDYLDPAGPEFRNPDPVRKVAPQVLWIPAGIPDENKARLVLEGFRRAVEKVYGQQWWHYWKGDLRRAKHFDKLLACAVQLHEHSVPAEHWAIWRLTWFRDKCSAFATKPPPVWMVMSAKTVSERAGWFRKDYDLPRGTVQRDEAILEQMMRNREASWIWKGMHDAHLRVFPPWYAEKRSREIARGLTKPHDVWPRAAHMDDKAINTIRSRA